MLGFAPVGATPIATLPMTTGHFVVYYGMCLNASDAAFWCLNADDTNTFALSVSDVRFWPIKAQSRRCH